MIVHVYDRKSQYSTTPECSNCGAKAVLVKLDKPKEIINGITIDSDYICPHGCIDEEKIV